MDCFIYCRKSTEDQARQIQSIADQKHILLELAHSRNLKVVEIFTDEKSAGKPYQRSGFQTMMKKVSSGEVSIILSWKIDRLSRNPIENGQISWMLQQGIIHEIITPERCYLPQDNVLLFMVEGAMANQYLRDLSANVKRGMNSSVERGIFPAYAPIGYLNDGKARGNKKIIPDPAIFPRLQNLWELIITGNYQLADLYRLMQDKYPLFRNGKPIAFSTFHRIFRNPFYCGLFKWNGKLHIGNHQSMVTQSDFNKVQSLLNRKDKCRLKELDFDFKGVFKCGTCNACITAERKCKFIKSKNKLKHFDYYKCAHHRRNIKCKEKPLSQTIIETQLFEEIKKITLPKEVIEFGLVELSKEDSKDTVANQRGLKQINQRIKTLITQQRAIENNIVLESDCEIRQIMKQKLSEIKIDLRKYIEDKETLSSKFSAWNEEIRELLQVISNARRILTEEGNKEKKVLLKSLGSNWEIKDRKVLYRPHFLCNAIKKVHETHTYELGKFEPSGTLMSKGKVLPRKDVYTMWYSLWELIKNPKNFLEIEESGI